MYEIETTPEVLTQPTNELLDYYKLTMSQFAFEQAPHAEVTFSFTNRTNIPLAEYVNPIDLQHALDERRERGFGGFELSYLSSLRDTRGERVFTDDYLHMLSETRMPEITIGVNEENDLTIESTGVWPMVSLWETIVMASVNEMYFDSITRLYGIDMDELYTEGRERIQQKMEVLAKYNANLPEGHRPVTFVDFGTRRHFSGDWHEVVIQELLEHAPNESFVGTSNVGFADKYGLKPVGTYAHEMPMVFAGMFDAQGEEVRDSHSAFMAAWAERYPDLRVALTDTFGDDFFFEDLADSELDTVFSGLRHDSGNPFTFAERAIAFYEARGIDPQTKTIVFSDGLELEKILQLHEQFGQRINVTFGWGTNLTNDLGIEALSIVMKATAVDGKRTVKLSNNPNKITGHEEDVERYIKTFNYVVEHAVREATKY